MVDSLLFLQLYSKKLYLYLKKYSFSENSCNYPENIHHIIMNILSFFILDIVKIENLLFII